MDRMKPGKLRTIKHRFGGTRFMYKFWSTDESKSNLSIIV